MTVFDIISLFGGLAMFLYGMRLLGNGLKEGSSGALKVALEKFTSNQFKAFLLGLLVTAVIQSSTATIVITAGLVAAGIIAFDKSLGIVIGANVGTTVTGQIIRLLDVQSDIWVLKIFEPSTLAPLALIVGIVLLIGFKFKRAGVIGNILIGFGILFMGLLTMRSAVEVLNESGFLTDILTGLGSQPALSYLAGATVAFILQSSSATVGILQSLASTNGILFDSLYVMLTGIYLGDCVTTAIVCSIGTKPEAKRVGIVNILFNLGKTILVLVVVNVVRLTGLLDGIWTMVMDSGSIADTNTIFNLGCAILLLPLVGVFAKLGKIIVKDKPEETKGAFAPLFDGLNPVFYTTPALAFRSCYDVLKASLDVACENINLSFSNLYEYSGERSVKIAENEKTVDELTDAVSNYMAKLYPNIAENYQSNIINQYYKLVTEFERLSDHATNIDESAKYLHDNGLVFSETAINELKILNKLLDDILQYSRQAFLRRDVVAARHIEPLEEVMDDLVNALHDNHLDRLRDGKCSVQTGTSFLDVLSNIERISDTCSNIGVSTISRVDPQIAEKAHYYTSSLHQGNDDKFNAEYEAAHSEYFNLLGAVENA